MLPPDRPVEDRLEDRGAADRSDRAVVFEELYQRSFAVMATAVDRVLS